MLEEDCFGEYEEDDKGCQDCDESNACKNATEDIKEDEQHKNPIITDTTCTKTPWDKDGGALAKEKGTPWWYYVICIMFPLLWPFIIFKIIMWRHRETKD